MNLLRFDIIRFVFALYLCQSFLTKSLSSQIDNVNKVEFFLYGCNNKDKALVFKYEPNLKTSPNTTTNFLKYFLTCFDIKIIAHGWRENPNDDSMQKLKNAYLKSNCYNIIIVNWSQYANELLFQKAANAAIAVGKHVANFINFLVKEHFTEIERIHLIGFELGAHLMGYCGQFSKQRLPRITGLDPSRLFFEIPKIFKPLERNDAEFVDIIHTTAGTTGMLPRTGRADFYPNAGVHPQPGCPVNKTYCSQERSVLYFAESISTKVGFYGYRCEHWEDFEYDSCKTDKIQMGEFVAKDQDGNYMLSTKSSAPFAEGKK